MPNANAYVQVSLRRTDLNHRVAGIAVHWYRLELANNRENHYFFDRFHDYWPHNREKNVKFSHYG